MLATPDSAECSQPLIQQDVPICQVAFRRDMRGVPAQMTIPPHSEDATWHLRMRSGI